jgi:NTP pyrophosphatase (non-canonical NTP hydrolase)
MTETKTDLTFAQLRVASLKRCPLFRNAKGQLCHPNGVMDWSPDRWMTALVGEVGEAANDIKKVNRGDLSLEEALPKIGSEIADAQTYLDLLAARLGLSLAEITIAKFNEVSQRVGCSIFLGEAPPARDPEQALIVEIANAVSGDWSLEDTPVAVREVTGSNTHWVAETRAVGGVVGHKAWGVTRRAALRALHRLVGAAPVPPAPTPETSRTAADPASCPECGGRGHRRQGDSRCRCHACEIAWHLPPARTPAGAPLSAEQQLRELSDFLDNKQRPTGDR